MFRSSGEPLEVGIFVGIRLQHASGQCGRWRKKILVVGGWMCFFSPGVKQIRVGFLQRCSPGFLEFGGIILRKLIRFHKQTNQYFMVHVTDGCFFLDGSSLGTS